MSNKDLIRDLVDIVTSIGKTDQMSHSGIQAELKPFIKKYNSLNFERGSRNFKIYNNVYFEYGNLCKAINENRENSYCSRKEIAKKLAEIILPK